MAEDNYESVDEKIVLFLLRPGMYLGRNCNHTNLDMKAVQMYNRFPPIWQKGFYFFQTKNPYWEFHVMEYKF